MPRTVVKSSNVWDSSPFKFSQGAITPAGRILFLAGQVGMDQSGKVVNGFQAQTKQALKNIDALLKECGASFADIVKLSVYLTSMENLNSCTEIMGEVMQVKDFPAQTVVEVKSLALKELMIEIEAVVSLPDRALSEGA
jgi:enamine deaminase RidA (YjgF/YER057c/UK114 family)